jgi:uncharacterized protein (DUF1778 family)
MASMERREISESPKTARLEARITEEQKELFLRAATLLGRSLSDFVVSCVYETATRTVRDHEVMTLSVRDREVFVSALLKSPAPGARLRKAARRYKEHAGK